MAELGILSRRFRPAEGGVENYLFSLCEELMASHRPRIVTQILGNHSDYPGVDDLFARTYSAPIHPGMEIFPLSPNRMDFIRLLPCGLKLLPGFRSHAYAPLKALAVRQFASVYFKRVRRFFQDAALIHSFSFDGLGLLGQRVAESLRIPFVITPFMHAGHWGDDPQNIRLYNSADLVLALHEEDAASLRNAGVRPELIRIGSVGIPAFSGNGKRFREKYRVEGPMILFVGRMVEHKGYRELVAAVRTLLNEGHALTLILMGPESAVSRKFTAEAAHPNIRFLGLLPSQEKYDALSACDLFCLPSDSEIMPVSILEAWHAGRPVLGGDIPALRCLIQEGKTGMFAQRTADSIGKQLRAFLDAPDHWRSIGENGQEEVSREHLIHHVAERHIRFYEEALLNKQDITRNLGGMAVN